MQFRQLRYFVKIVEAGSFSRAAASIHISQPALSKRIAELEDELGVGLLHRTARGVTPTSAGDVLYEQSVKLIRQMDDLPTLLQARQGEAQGMVCFGMSSTMAPTVTGRLVELCKTALPQVTLRFVIADSHSLREKVLANTVELAIVFEDGPVNGFTREVLFRQRLHLAGRKEADVAASTTLASIATLPLMLPSPTNVLRQALDSRMAAIGLSVAPIAESDLFDVHIAAVESGLCYTVLPTASFAVITGRDGIATAPIEPPIFLTACLIANRDRPLASAAQAVGSQLKALVRSRLPDFAGAEWLDDEP